MITFSQVMDFMSGDDVFNLLNTPKEVDIFTLFLLRAWIRPPIVEGNKLTEIMFQSGIVDSLSEARRKIKENAVKWNGARVIEDRMVDFFSLGWGVVQLGKKNHRMVINKDCV